MRARYYSPDMKRFINADIIPGEISNAVTLNRFAYANGNPVSFVDPFGLTVDVRGNSESEASAWQNFIDIMGFDGEELLSGIEGITMTDVTTSLVINEDALGAIYAVFKMLLILQSAPREWENVNGLD